MPAVRFAHHAPEPVLAPEPAAELPPFVTAKLAALRAPRVAVAVEPDEPAHRAAAVARRRGPRVEGEAAEAREEGAGAEDDDLLQQYDPHYSPAAVVSERHAWPAPAPRARSSTLRIEVSRFGFQADLEPLFGALALYDTRSRCRVSEVFTFLTGPLPADADPAQLGGLTPDDPLSACRTADFVVPDEFRHERLFVVAQLSKVLLGDADAAAEPYTRSSRATVDVGKLRARFADSFERMGKHRQPLAWTASQLFDHSGRLLEPSADNASVRQLQCFRQRAGVSDEQRLADIDGLATQSHREIPAQCVLVLSSAPPSGGDETVVLSPQLSCTADDASDLPALAEGAAVVRTVPAIAAAPPAGDFVNTLYVRLGAVDKISQRNLAVRVQVMGGSEADEPLRALYGAAGQPALVAEAYSEVTYHSRTPSFGTEFKVRLPLVLRDDHQLFFSVFHVHCKKGGAADELVAQGALPLFAADAPPADGAHSVRLMSHAAGRRASMAPGELVVHTRLWSSVYCQDPNVERFLREQPPPPGPAATVDEPSADKVRAMTEAAAALAGGAAPAAAVAQHLGSLMTHLLTDLAAGDGIVSPDFRQPHHDNELRAASFEALLAVMAAAPRDALRAYVDWTFDDVPVIGRWSPFVYQVLLRQWARLAATCVLGRSQTLKTSLQFADVLFGLVLKSLVLSRRSSPDGLEGGEVEVGEMAEADVETLQQVLDLCALEARSWSTQGLSSAKHVNRAVAHLLRDLLNVVPQATVRQLAERYLEQLGGGGAAPSAEVIGLVGVVLNVLTEYDFLEDVGAWLPELVAREVIAANAYREARIRLRTLRLLRSCLARHAYDERLRADPPRFAAVVATYMPLLERILALSQDWRRASASGSAGGADETERRELLASALFIMQSAPEERLRAFWRASEDDSPAAGSSPTRAGSVVLTRENTRAQLVAASAASEPADRLQAFFDLLRYALDVFEYAPDRDLLCPAAADAAREATTAAGKAESKLAQLESLVANRRATGAGGGGAGAGSMRARNKSMPRQWARKRPELKGAFSADDEAEPDSEPDPQEAGAEAEAETETETESEQKTTGDDDSKRLVATAATRVVCDTLALFVSEFEAELRDPAGRLLKDVTRVFLHALRRRHSYPALSTVFRHLSRLLQRFHPQIVAQGLLAREEWCRQCLRRAAAATADAAVRQQATAFILEDVFSVHMLNTGSLTRMRVPLLAVVHELDGVDLEAHEVQGGGEPALRAQLSALVAQLRAVRRAARADADENALHAAVEVFLPTELPRHRITWLQRLAEHHEARERLEEAAACQLRVAGTIERARAAGLWQHSSDAGADVREALAAAVDRFARADMPEKALQVQERVCALTAAFADRLAAHQRAAELAQAVLDAQRGGPDIRMLGTYFRVGFYGACLPAGLDGQEFVYKEPKITRLMELKDRILATVGAQLPEGVQLQVLPDSRKVQRDALEPDGAYVQITTVEPFFLPEEEPRRATHFERNCDLRRFSFRTPFTQGGKAHGSTAEQFQLLTVVELAHAFPCCRTRQPVAATSDIVMTPIECTIADVKRRVHLMQLEVDKPEPDRRTLTQLLQGSVMLQVNGGPTEAAEAFLSDDSQPLDDHAPERAAELRVALRRELVQFLMLCQRLILISRPVMVPPAAPAVRQRSATQSESHAHRDDAAAAAALAADTDRQWQEEVEAGYQQMVDKLFDALQGVPGASDLRKIAAALRLAASAGGGDVGGSASG